MYAEHVALALREAAACRTARAERAWGALSTPAAVHRFQAAIRARCWSLLGGMPSTRTPLRPRVTGIVDCGPYRVEKLRFESLPRFPVTANIYVPRGLAGRAPAILFANGHAPGAKAFPEYQRCCANLALRGFVVLTFDPFGQGERGPHYSVFHGETGGNAHDVQGFQCFLTDRPLAFYWVWDAIRAIDCLCGRPDVDPARIGCTGTSGGGMLTTQLAALDTRIAALAPACNTGWPLDVFTYWMTHPEGNFAGAFDVTGPNNVNFAICAAPRPQLLLGGTEDHLPAGGMHAVCARARLAYRALGAADRLQCVTSADHHGFPPALRESMYAFFTAALRPAGRPPEREVVTEPLAEPRLRVTRGGDVREWRGTNIHRLNRTRALALARTRRPPATRGACAARLAAALRLDALDDLPLRVNAAGSGGACEEGARFSQHEVHAGRAAGSVQRVTRYTPPGRPAGRLLFIREFGYPDCGDLLRAALAHGNAVLSGELHPLDHQRFVWMGASAAGWHARLWQAAVARLAPEAGARGDRVPWRIVCAGPLAGLVALHLALSRRRPPAAFVWIGGCRSLADTLNDARDVRPAALQSTPGFLTHLDLPDVWRVLGCPIRFINPLYPQRRWPQVSGDVSRTVFEPENGLYHRLGIRLFGDGMLNDET